MLSLQQCRHLSTRTTMKAWQTACIGASLQLANIPLPRIVDPRQMVVRVAAASVNPIDVAMARRDYGNTIFRTLRQLTECSLSVESAYPMTVGRDCSGTVEQVGQVAAKKFRVGDEVMCVVAPHNPGTHAEYALINCNHATPKPRMISHTHAAAVPYVACTVWTALVTIGRLQPNRCAQLRVLVHGGAGGVGTTAVQLLRAWGAEVTVTCSADSLELMRRLGAEPIDYQDEVLAFDKLVDRSPYDVIFDTVDSVLSRRTADLLGIWRNCIFVTVVSPLLRETDKRGLPIGLATTAIEYAQRAYQQGATNGRWFSYAYFAANIDCLEHLSHLMEDGKFSPVIDNVYQFSNTPQAYDKVAAIHGSRGKTIIDFSSIQ